MTSYTYHEEMHRTYKIVFESNVIVVARALLSSPWAPATAATHDLLSELRSGTLAFHLQSCEKETRPTLSLYTLITHVLFYRDDNDQNHHHHKNSSSSFHPRSDRGPIGGHRRDGPGLPARH